MSESKREYERLKEEIIATAAGYTGDIKALTTRLMTIIADKCVFLDKNQDLPKNPYTHLIEQKVRDAGYTEAQYKMLADGYQRVIEIKKEE